MKTIDEPELVLHGHAPLHQQIQDQLRAQIMAGVLRPGEQLPTVRAVAVQLAVNPNLVSRAYGQLQREGFLTTEDGSGTFVAPALLVQAATAERQARLELFCKQYLSYAQEIGFNAEEVLSTTESLTCRGASHE